MAKKSNGSFLQRMKENRKQNGSMKGYIFVFILVSVAILMSYGVGFIEITDGVNTLYVTGEKIIKGVLTEETAQACAGGTEGCLAPYIYISKIPLFAFVYIGTIFALVSSFFISKYRSLTYLNALIYAIIAILVVMAPNMISFTDSAGESIRSIVKPTLNSGGSVTVILSVLALAGNLIVYRMSGNN